MNARWLIGLMAGASLLAGSALAADGQDADLNFDQGVSIPEGTSLPAKTSPAPQAADQVMSIKTYSFSGRTGHPKGFRPHNGAKRDYKTEGDFSIQGSVDIPDTLDLRPNLTQIEDQGQCGDCWAFSITATNRDGHALGGQDPGRLSQEWLADNAKEADGCNGGDFDAANELISPAGQPSWDSCPYAEGKGGCDPNLPPAPNSSITAWHMLGSEKSGPSVKDIESYIARTGKPVSIAIAAGSGDWEKYSGGVYNGCTDGQLDHMINIVGWDNEGATFNKKGNLPAGKGIWILRNSWGTSWGEGGYMRTKMTDSKGTRCNEVAAQAAYFDFAQDQDPSLAKSRGFSTSGGR